MARTKLIALVVVAALSITATVTAAASAASKGEFVNSSGTRLVKNQFTATSGETKLETVGGTKLTCKAALALGIDTSTTGGEGTTHFTGCTASGLACKSVKPAGVAGEVILLTAALVQKLSATQDTGLTTILAPGTKTAGEVELECSGLKIKVKGSFYGNGITVNAGLKTLWPATATQTKGVQSVLKNEAGVEKHLEISIEGKAFEQMAVEGTGTAHFLEEGQFV